LNSFRRLHPLFALQGILDHLTNRPRRHTRTLRTLLNPVRRSANPPNTPGPSRKPLEPSSIAKRKARNERRETKGAKRTEIEEIDDPNALHPSPKSGRKGPAWTNEAPISTPPAVDLMPSLAKAEEPLPKAAQVPPKTLNLTEWPQKSSAFVLQGKGKNVERSERVGGPSLKLSPRQTFPNPVDSLLQATPLLPPKHRLIGSTTQCLPNKPSYPRSDSPSSSKAFRPQLNTSNRLTIGARAFWRIP